MTLRIKLRRRNGGYNKKETFAGFSTITSGTGTWVGGTGSYVYTTTGASTISAVGTAVPTRTAYPSLAPATAKTTSSTLTLGKMTAIYKDAVAYSFDIKKWKTAEWSGGVSDV